MDLKQKHERMLELHQATEEKRVEMKTNRKEQVKFIRDNYLNQMEKLEKKEAEKNAKLARKQQAEAAGFEERL